MVVVAEPSIRRGKKKARVMHAGQLSVEMLRAVSKTKASKGGESRRGQSDRVAREVGEESGGIGCVKEGDLRSLLADLLFERLDVTLYA